MPPKPLSAVVILCEKVLQEKNDLVSAIRIADLFHVPNFPEVPLDKKGVVMYALAMCKFEPDDISTHSLQLHLIRPNEGGIDVGPPLEFPLGNIEVKTPGAPRGVNMIAEWGLTATVMGLHRLVLLIDGVESASTLFTLAQAPETRT